MFQHTWKLQPLQAIKLQRNLAKKVRHKNGFKNIKLIVGADVGFDKEGKRVFGVMVVLTYRKLNIIESARVVLPVKFPYVPGLLSFREGPVLLKAYQKLKTKSIFVSPGHKIDTETEVIIILSSSQKYRISVSIRQSHQLAHFTAS